MSRRDGARERKPWQRHLAHEIYRLHNTWWKTRRRPRILAQDFCAAVNEMINEMILRDSRNAIRCSQWQQQWEPKWKRSAVMRHGKAGATHFPNRVPYCTQLWLLATAARGCFHNSGAMLKHANLLATCSPSLEKPSPFFFSFEKQRDLVSVVCCSVQHIPFLAGISLL